MGAELASSCAGSALGWAWCPRPLRAHRRAISEAWRRASAPSLAMDPGPSDCVVSPAPESLAPDICAKQPTVSRPPQVNWGVSACNTHNEVSIALAKFNYRSICFLIFPRWLDVFFFPHNYKGTDCTVALCRRVRDSGCFFQIPLLRSVRSHRVAAADRCYREGFERNQIPGLTPHKAFHPFPFKVTKDVDFL